MVVLDDMKLPLLCLSSYCGAQRITKTSNMCMREKKNAAPQEKKHFISAKCPQKDWSLVCVCACVSVCECVPNGCATQKSMRASTQRLLISIWVEVVHSWLPWEDRNYTLPEGRWQSEKKRDMDGVREPGQERHLMKKRNFSEKESESTNFARTRDETR